jgi:hypothetical protein
LGEREKGKGERGVLTLFEEKDPGWEKEDLSVLTKNGFNESLFPFPFPLSPFALLKVLEK